MNVYSLTSRTKLLVKWREVFVGVMWTFITWWLVKEPFVLFCDWDRSYCSSSSSLSVSNSSSISSSWLFFCSGIFSSKTASLYLFQAKTPYALKRKSYLEFFALKTMPKVIDRARDTLPNKLPVKQIYLIFPSATEPSTRWCCILRRSRVYFLQLLLRRLF